MQTLAFSINGDKRRAILLAEGTFLLESATLATFPVIDNTMYGAFKALVRFSGEGAKFYDANGKKMSAKAVREACE